MPELGRVVIADVGSLTGVLTRRRSSGKPRVSSMQQDRQVILLDWGEAASLRLGAHKITIGAFPPAALK